MPRYLVTINQTITVTADSEEEAKSVAAESLDLYGAETHEVTAEKSGA